MKPKQQRPQAKLKRASSVVLLARRSPGGPTRYRPNTNDPSSLRVLMVKRASRTSHMSSLLVFPGGSVDEQDFPISMDTINTDSTITSTHPSFQLLTNSNRQTPIWEGLHPTSSLFSEHNTTSSSSLQKNKKNHTDDAMSLSVSFAHRATALREIFEESGLLGIPHCSSTPQGHNHAHLPTFSPLDLDQYYSKLINSGNDNEYVIKALDQMGKMAKELKIPMHELFRRMIHLNDQSILDDIYKIMNKDNNINNNDGSATFINFCNIIEILTNPTNTNKEKDSKNNQNDSSNITSAISSSSSSSPSKHTSKLTINGANDGDLTIYDTLTPFAKWVSPLVEPKRFDTNFYVSLVDTNSVEFCSPENFTKNNYQGPKNPSYDRLDSIMSHFKSIAQIKTPDPNSTYVRPVNNGNNGDNGITTLTTPEERIKSHLERLRSSTLSHEISNIAWVTPLDILTRLDIVTLAPPTQYILSQLAGFVQQDDLSSFLSSSSSSSSDPPHQHSHTNSYLSQHTPQCPLRSPNVSNDPYTLTTIQNLIDNNQIDQYQPKFENAYFPSPPQLSYFNNNNKTNNNNNNDNTNIMIKTKGYVLLPQDFQHPLTNSLLIHALNLLNNNNNTNNNNNNNNNNNYNNNNNNTNNNITTAHNSNDNNNNNNKVEFTNMYQEYSQTGTVSHKWYQDLNFDQCANIILTESSPPIKLSGVHIYSDPFKMFEEHDNGNNDGNKGEKGEKSEKSEKNIKNAKELFHKDPFISQYLQSKPDIQSKLRPLVHFHRIVDGLVHNNWEIVTSNANIVAKTKQDLGISDIHYDPPLDAKL